MQCRRHAEKCGQGAARRPGVSTVCHAEQVGHHWRVPNIGRGHCVERESTRITLPGPRSTRSAYTAATPARTTFDATSETWDDRRAVSGQRTSCRLSKYQSHQRLEMGGPVVEATIGNGMDPCCRIVCDTLVDTDAAYLTLPNVWRSRRRTHGLRHRGRRDSQPGRRDRPNLRAGPLSFGLLRRVLAEVLFIDMARANGRHEPLAGYIPLEQAQAVVDLAGHRLAKVDRVDLKRLPPPLPSWRKDGRHPAKQRPRCFPVHMRRNPASNRMNTRRPRGSADRGS